MRYAVGSDGKSHKVAQRFAVGSDGKIHKVTSRFVVASDGTIKKIFSSVISGIIVSKNDISKSGTSSQTVVRTEKQSGEYCTRLYVYYDTSGYGIGSVRIPYANASTSTRVEFDIGTYTEVPYSTAPGYRCGLRTGTTIQRIEANTNGSLVHMTVYPLGTTSSGFIYLDFQTGISSASYKAGALGIENIKVDGIPILLEKVSL